MNTCTDMIKTTKPQRKALYKLWQRIDPKDNVKYIEFRKRIEPGPGCIMVRYANMWLGIEPDGYTHG
jgi:hypothetical protein